MEAAQIKLAETIQQVFHLDSPPAITIENTGRPAGHETTTQVSVGFSEFVRRFLITVYVLC